LLKQLIEIEDIQAHGSRLSGSALANFKMGFEGIKWKFACPPQPQQSMLCEVKAGEH